MPLRFIHLEDNPLDRDLVAETLRDEQLDCTIVAVASQDAFEEALAGAPDLILADFSLPGFSGDAAHELARTRCPDVPFVFVSGSIGEHKAVEQLRRGATDYVLKHHLDKLPTAVRRALREADDRRQRARAEAALRLLNAELEARVEERTQALREANQALREAQAEADRASRAKSEFLSRMSHDLRTPLSAIMGFAQVLQLDSLPAEQADSVSHILQGGEHLLNLINEVLDLARIEAGRLTLSLEPVSVSEVLAQAVGLIEPLAAQRAIAVTLDADTNLHAVADRQRLAQVALNLLSNAVKYNRRGGTVHVRARRDIPTRVYIEVADTGAGIPPDKLALLFTPFERLGAEYSETEGTGLGLALAQQLTQAMHGAMTVDSVLSAGTLFRVDLPAADTSPGLSPEPTPEAPVAIGTNGTVLHVEDNASNAQLMRRLLSRRPGVELTHAPDGRTALELITRDHPDLVILDLHLSDMSGEDVLRRIREDPMTRGIPIAVLSADATLPTRRRVLASGAMSYLTKPFAISDMLDLVDRALGRPQ